MGDLGNVLADSTGFAYAKYPKVDIPLTGTYSIIGRGCVVHAGLDELGVGTSVGGARIACGVIGYEEEWEQ